MAPGAAERRAEMARARFSDAARRATLLAQAEAGERRCNDLRPAHLLFALLEPGAEAAGLLRGLDPDPSGIRKLLEPHLGGAEFRSEGGIRPTPAYRAVEVRAYEEMRRRGGGEVLPRDLLLAVLRGAEDPAVRDLADAGMTESAARAAFEAAGGEGARPSLFARLFGRR